MLTREDVWIAAFPILFDIFIYTMILDLNWNSQDLKNICKIFVIRWFFADSSKETKYLHR